MNMRNILKYASLLFAAAVLGACGDPVEPDTPVGPDKPGPEKPEVTGTLALTVDKQIIQSNGTDAATLTVTLNGEPVTSDVIFHDSQNNDAVIEVKDFKFTTSKTGEYGIWAEYYTLMSNEVKITSFAAEIPSTPSDPEPSNTSFVRRSLLTQFTGTGCMNCPGMKTLLTSVFSEPEMADKVVRTAVHSYNEDDPAFISKYITASSYPMINLDLVETTGYGTGTTPADIKNWMNAIYSGQEAMAGISVNSAYKDGQLVIKAAVKAAVEGQYRIGALLMEDGIEGQQTGAKPSETEMHIHNHCVRYADCASNFYGHKLGTIKAGETAEYFFCWDLNDASMQWNKKPYGGSIWKAPVMENAYLVLCVYVPDSSGRATIVNNAVVAEIGTSVQFEYK